MERRKPLVAKTGLKRSSQLRAKPSDKKREPRARIQPRGARASRVDPVYALSCALVDERSKGRCERPGCNQPATDHHHIWGRRSRVGWFWSNQPQSLLHLCHECHDEVTRKPRIGWATAVKWVAVSWLAGSLGLDWSRYLDDFGEQSWTPLQAAGDLIRRSQQTSREAA